MDDMTMAAFGQPLGIASTHGWDTVYGIRFSLANSAIARAHSSPADFDHSETAGGETNRIFGTFGDWSISGGAGHLLNMNVPIPTFTYEPDGAAPITRSNAIAVIEVELQAIPQPANATADGGVPHALRLRLPNQSNSSVSVQSLTYPGSESDGDLVGEIRLLLQGWMREAENLARFNHTFAVVNLNAKAAVAELNWVMPTRLGYGVVAQGEDDGVLAVLCMTENRDPPSDAVVSVELLPRGVNSAFLISKERYLSKMVLPSLGFMFSRPAESRGRIWPKDWFELAGNGTMLRNTFDLSIDKFRTEHGEVRATIPAGMFSVTLEDTHCELRMSEFRHPYREGWFNAVHSITAQMQAAINEQQKIVLMPASGDPETPIIHHKAVLAKTPLAEIFDWMVIGLEIAAIVVPIGRLAYARYAGAAVAEAGAAVNIAADVTQVGPAAAEQAGPAVAGGAQAAGNAIAAGGPHLNEFLLFNNRVVHVGIMAALGAIPLSLEIFEKLATEGNMAAKEIPDISAFVTSIMKPVQWPDQAEFHVDSVAFNGGLHVIGTPGFTS